VETGWGLNASKIVTVLPDVRSSASIPATGDDIPHPPFPRPAALLFHWEIRFDHAPVLIRQIRVVAFVRSAMLLASGPGPHQVRGVVSVTPWAYIDPDHPTPFRTLPRFDRLGAQQVNIVVVVVGMLVSTLFVGSVVAFARERNRWRSVQLLGSFCLIVVVLSHVAEAFQLLPGMGWGLPNTRGHYLDLCTAIIGLILLPLGYVLARRRSSS
jgi:ABC-type glycerol-3-phosphate transport system permease component